METDRSQLTTEVRLPGFPVGLRRPGFRFGGGNTKRGKGQTLIRWGVKKQRFQ